MSWELAVNFGKLTKERKEGGDLGKETKCSGRYTVKKRMGISVRTQRLRWLEHVQRLPEQKMTKQVLVGGITGRRPRGRPRTKRIEAVQKDLHQLQIRNWKQLAITRRNVEASVTKPWASSASKAVYYYMSWEYREEGVVVYFGLCCNTLFYCNCTYFD